MAAPTDVRVEATSLTTTVLNWTYGGAAFVDVYRSIDGAAYSFVASVTVGTLTYTDTGLSAGTKYWYKLSDDAGSTFSSVVTVFTHTCPSERAGNELQLPRFDGEEQQSTDLNEMAERIETVLQGRVLNPEECAVCPSDGAITISCVDGCNTFVVIVDQDINSISIDSCLEGDERIEFIIPPSTTRKICGWPAGFGFTGDECFQAPIAGGTAGRSIFTNSRAGKLAPNSGTSKTGYGGSGGGIGAGADCTCIPGSNGQLTIKSCNANNSLNCSSTKTLKLKACGGRAPYTWSKTGSISISRTTGTSVEVTPPANPGSGVAGRAYTKQANGTFSAGCALQCRTVIAYTCNDVEDASTGGCGAGASCPGAGVISPCDSLDTTVHYSQSVDCATKPLFDDSCAAVRAVYAFLCDTRTAPMIADGCTPCGLVGAGAGSTVTVTDSVGTATTMVIKA
jgi:hypothetical protein